MRKQSITSLMRKLGIKLNERQSEVVKELDGEHVVIAGPGTGKTALITSKALYAVATDPGSNVLVVTFTKKAVNELQGRIAGAQGITVSTLHAFFYRIIRENGYKTFRFFQTDQQKKRLIKDIIIAMGYKDEVTVDDVAQMLTLGKAKNAKVTEIFNAYLDNLKARRMICFDSLQYLVFELLENYPGIAARIRNHYDYILVDEAQDISGIQANILKAIWPNEFANNITLVGDRKQSIYGFRGTAFGIMDDLAKHYQAKVHCLTINYRSTPTILQLAAKVHPSDEALVAARKLKGNNPVFWRVGTPEQEAERVIEEVGKLHNEGLRLKDMVILFRSSTAVSSLFEKLVEKEIPFIKIGSDCSYWNNSEFKRFISLIGFCFAKNNRHFKCCLPIFGINEGIVRELSYDYRSLSFIDQILLLPSISIKQREKIQEFKNIDPNKLMLRDLSCKLWDAFLREYFQVEDDSILEHWLDVTDKFSTYNELWRHISMVRRQYKKMERLVTDPNADFLRLMSIHSSKGLEFDTVFIVGCADGILPSSHEGVDKDEEQRLAYVGVTRAENRIYISYPEKNGTLINESSPFFKEFFE